MQPLISICIPTCDRSTLLQEAIESCLAQDYRPLEILIGDDSSDARTEQLIAGLDRHDGVSIKYWRNQPALGQSGNVNHLFESAQGKKLVLLHDDDRLVRNGLDHLVKALQDHPDSRCLYGKQFVINPQGIVLDGETEAWNRRYFRTDAYVGAQSSALLAGLWQQVPNNSFLIDTDLARLVRYRTEREIGQCVDADFAIRVGLVVPTAKFVFIREFVSQYRLTPASIARSTTLNRRQDLLFEFVEGIKTTPEETKAKFILLNRIATGASLDAAKVGRRRLALTIIVSRYYSLPMFSRWTLYRLMCVLSPALGTQIKKGLVGWKAGRGIGLRGLR